MKKHFAINQGVKNFRPIKQMGGGGGVNDREYKHHRRLTYTDSYVIVRRIYACFDCFMCQF